jgi:hypothetical protein
MDSRSSNGQSADDRAYPLYEREENSTSFDDVPGAEREVGSIDGTWPSIAGGSRGAELLQLFIENL